MNCWKKPLAPENVHEIQAAIDDAYGRGWNACLEEVRICVERAAARSLRSMPDRTARVTSGSWENMVRDILARAHAPLTMSDLLREMTRKDERPVPRSSVYLALERLRKRGVVQRLPDRRWCLHDAELGS